MQAYYIIPVPSGPGGPVDPGYGHPIPPGQIWGGAGQPGPFPNPPGFWGGGNVPMPNPPIANVPGAPGYQPPWHGDPGFSAPPGWGTWGGAGQPGPFPNPPGQGGGTPPGFWGGGPHPMPPVFYPNPPGPGDKPPDLPPGVPPAPQNPAVMPAGTLMPHADIPGTGTVWLLGNFPGYDWRWVAVDAGPAPAAPHPEHPIANVPPAKK